MTRSNYSGIHSYMTFNHKSQILHLGPQICRSSQGFCYFCADVYLRSRYSYTTYIFYLGDQPQSFTASDGSAPLERLERLLMDGRVIFPSQSWIWSNVLVSAGPVKLLVTGSQSGVQEISALHQRVFYFNIYCYSQSRMIFVVMGLNLS